MEGSIYERATELMEAALGDEIVALEPEGGHCFGFNTVAASVWRQLEQPRSFAQLQAALLDEYDVGQRQCADELAELLKRLEAEGLIRAQPPHLPQS